MSVLGQLEQPDFRASKADRVLMEYICRQAAVVPHTAIAQLAQQAGVSEATITRFVKKMGYDGLQAFKLALARELTQRGHRSIISSSICSEESAKVTGRKLLDANISTLEKTLASLPEGRIEACAALLRAAKRLRFIGLGNSGFVAREAAYKFYRIGFDSMGLDDSHWMLMMASLARAGDLILAVSHSGASPEVLKALELGKKQGAVTIAITSSEPNAMAKAADLHISYEARESRLETGSITAKLAQVFIMELMYTQIVKAMPEAAEENKRRTTMAMDLLRE